MITGINSLAITGSITLYEIEIMHRDQCSSANFTGVSFKWPLVVYQYAILLPKDRRGRYFIFIFYYQGSSWNID